MKFVLMLFCVLVALPASALEFNMATASERGTYFAFCHDMQKVVAAPAHLELGCLPTAGSVENVKRLRYDVGVKLALVQADVFQAFMNAAHSDHDAADMVKPLRVILPLYNEEFYFIVRADSPLKYIHEIKDKRISAGPLGSGTSLSVVTLYGEMFHAALPQTAKFQPNEDALVELTTKGDLDVVAVTGGQPMKLLADMKPEARKLIRILEFDPNNEVSKAALGTYTEATVRKISYPSLIDEDFPTLAVRTLLVTYDFGYGNARQRPSAQRLVSLARSLCTKLPQLQDQGHSKWRDVRLEMPNLGKGWSYYEPTAKVLESCGTAPPKCSQQALVLGLCEPDNVAKRQ